MYLKIAFFATIRKERRLTLFTSEWHFTQVIKIFKNCRARIFRQNWPWWSCRELVTLDYD
jgi:hypothetical protein